MRRIVGGNRLLLEEAAGQDAVRERGPKIVRRELAGLLALEPSSAGQPRRGGGLVGAELAHERAEAARSALRCVAGEEARQRELELARCREAILTRPRERLHDDAIDLGRHVGTPLARRWNLGAAHEPEQPLEIVLRVEHLPGEHLVQQDSRREDVAAVVNRIAPGLLG